MKDIRYDRRERDFAFPHPDHRESGDSLWTKIEKTQTKSPSNHSLSHERESEQSERASKRVSAAEGTS